VPEKQVTDTASPKRAARNGAGTRLRMASVRCCCVAPSVRSNTEWSPKASASRAKCSASKKKRCSGPCAASGVAAKYSAMDVLAACRVRRKRSGISSPVS
jgi:hypothetical protein